MESRSRKNPAARLRADAAERVRYDARHKPVDHFGLVYSDDGPNAPTLEPEAGDDRHVQRRGGTLDPYHRGDPGEASPHDSPARPKAPPVHQATADGRLYEPAREDTARGDREKPLPKRK